MRPFSALIAACVSTAALAAQEPLTVTWQAPQPLRGLYEKHLKPSDEISRADHREVAVRAWIRDVRKRVPEIAASEGYFSPTLDIRFDDDRRIHATVVVAPGPRTTVEKVDIRFAGDLAGEGEAREARRREVRAAWTLPPGVPFRSADWETAKTRLQETASEIDYAGATLASSEARVDAESSKADLTVVVDSGPRFTLGDVFIEGLRYYPEAVIRRLVDLKHDERFSRERLEGLQRGVQNGPWFSSVVVDIERDAAHPERAPVRITVVERPRREIGVALGYGTDDGARAETAFRDRDLFHRGLDLQSSIRAAQRDQIGYVDVYLPPGLFGSRHGEGIPFTDSVGILAQHSTIQKLALSRFAAAGYRHFRLDAVEVRTGLSYQVERAYPEGADPTLKRALAPVVSGTWRFVDNLYDPRRGGVLNVQFAAGTKRLLSGEDFFKAYAQYQHWIPLGENDQILLRGEAGRTFTTSRAHLPEDFLFRAGGSRSNRGYAYQGLGVREGDAIVGGRYVATATAEYVHWLNERWGAAVFTDVGDAADIPHDLNLNPSYGAGARFKTPAGPLALDLAWADRERRFRFSFSVTVAF